MYFSQFEWHPGVLSGQPLHGPLNNFQRLLYAVSAASDGTGVTHSIQKFLLIRARMFTRQLHLDINSPSIRNTVPHDVALAVFPDVNDTAILGEELPYRMVPNDAAVFTESDDYLVL